MIIMYDKLQKQIGWHHFDNEHDSQRKGTAEPAMVQNDKHICRLNAHKNMRAAFFINVAQIM